MYACTKVTLVLLHNGISSTVHGKEPCSGVSDTTVKGLFTKSSLQRPYRDQIMTTQTGILRE